MFPGYELVVAPGGSKLKAAGDPDAPDAAIGDVKVDPDGFGVMLPGHGHLIAMGNGTHARLRSFTVQEFITPWLEWWVTQNGAAANHVEDKTGLTGKYDFTLKFDDSRRGAVVVGSHARAAMAEAGASANDVGSGLPTIFKAVEQQLGLRLVKAKGFPLDVIVIDHAEKAPVEN
jgi:uncharacterized protein (TIGR03435 family)